MSDWKTKRCADCEYAIALHGPFDEGTFECRQGPPTRGRYTMHQRVIDEAHYPIVTAFTPACSQFKQRGEPAIKVTARSGT